MTILELWLPILSSATAVWIASAIFWMVLPFHKSDYRGLPDEEQARDALREVPPGQYNVPHLSDRNTPDGKRKFEEGPVILMTVVPHGLPNMAKSLGQWFAFNLFIALTVAYLASRTLPPATDYLQVFRVAGTTAWLAYGAAVIQESIWFGRPWSISAKQLVDATIYALLTAGLFGWLWPR